MSCRMNRCCFFNNSKDASFASGLYTGIISVLTIIFMFTTGFVNEFRAEDNTQLAIFIVAVLLEILFFVFSVLLLYGVKKGKRLFAIPWMVWMIINISLQCISVVLICVLLVQVFNPGNLVILLTLVMFIGLNITCLIVVKTHYQDLSSTTNVNIDQPVNYEKFLMPA